MGVERAAERGVAADREGGDDRGAVAAAGLQAARADEPRDDRAAARLDLPGHLVGVDGRRHVRPRP